MTPKAQQLYNLLSDMAARYDKPAPSASPERSANREEWVKLLRDTAAYVEQRGTKGPVREAAE